MKRVTGVGGVFFKSADPKKLGAWYQQHLGLTPDPDGHVCLWFREDENPHRRGYVAWSPFKSDTTYFDPSKKPFMVNYRVADLHELLQALREEGVEVDEKIEDSEWGKFGWIMDPEGNRIELWEPPAEQC